jgi:hypothetical protein
LNTLIGKKKPIPKTEKAEKIKVEMINTDPEQEKMNKIIEKYHSKYLSIMKALKKLTNILKEEDMINLVKILLTTPGFAM